MKARLGVAISVVAVVLAACSGTGGVTIGDLERSRVGGLGRRRLDGGRQRADDLRGGVIEGCAREGQGGVRGGEPGHDADDLDGLVGGARDADRAGRPGRRLPVGRHDEPEEARRQGAGRRRRRAVRRQQAHDHRPDRQPGRDRLAGRPRQARRQGHRRRRRGADHEVRRRSSSTTSPRSRATRPTSPPPTPRTSRRRRTTSRRVVAKIELGEGDAGIVYVTDAKASDKVKTDRRPRRRERAGHL